MRYNRLFYRITALLLGGFVSVACIYDNYEEEGNVTENTPFSEGFSLNLRLTLDNMGGSRATNSAKLKDFENYIDPEKCRVLFFDYNDEFLFESKSRWVKQLAPNGEGEQWMVSVPMYPYGNDVKESWNWEEIRHVITATGSYKKNGREIFYADEYNAAHEARIAKAKAEGRDASTITPYAFKIAVLVNRPSMEVYPDLETEDKDGTERGADNFDNNGPHWTKDHTRFETDAPMTIFDLHHSQPDPIYRDKGFPTNGSNDWRTRGFGNFYDFIMGNDGGALTLSSTSSWVDYGVNNDDDSSRKAVEGSSTRRYARKADTDYPIPMYGVQAFDKIENWVEGVPFNLSSFVEGTDDSEEESSYEHKPLAMLRSVVKLELVLPKKFTHDSNGQPITGGDADVKVDYIALAYSNIYARCEPMDVWTPTDELWTKGHDESTDCEWFTLKKYTRIVESGREGDYARKGTLFERQGSIGNDYDVYNFHAYRRRISWLYGSWLEKGWPFKGLKEFNNGTGKEGQSVVQEIVDERRKEGAEPPHIFNPCIQRNLRVLLDNANLYDGYADDADNYHYVVYTGERNSIDPNFLYRVDNTDTFRATSCFWMVGIVFNGTKYLYAFPITQYEKAGNPALLINTYDNIISYEGDFPKDNGYLDNGTYGKAVVGQKLEKDGDEDLLPWPLMRNHHYTVKIGGIATRSGGGGMEFMVSSSESHSETL